MSRIKNRTLFLFLVKEGKLLDIKRITDFEGESTLCYVCGRSSTRGKMVNDTHLVCEQCIREANMLFDLESMGL